MMEAVPVIDLRLLSQSEISALARSTNSEDPLRRIEDDLVIPVIDRSIFNESAGSRKQTYSRLRLASRGAPSSSPFPPAPDNGATAENQRIVAHLRRLFTNELPPPPPPSLPPSLPPAVPSPFPPASDRELSNASGLEVDLVKLAEKVDPFAWELRKMTEGMRSEQELLGFLSRLSGKWGSQRKRRKIVDAAAFGDHLPCGWKLLLGLKRKDGIAWINCREYVSPSGRRFTNCREVSSYLTSLVGHMNTAAVAPIPVQAIEMVDGPVISASDHKIESEKDKSDQVPEGSEKQQADVTPKNSKRRRDDAVLDDLPHSSGQAKASDLQNVPLPEEPAKESVSLISTPLDGASESSKSAVREIIQKSEGNLAHDDGIPETVGVELDQTNSMVVKEANGQVSPREVSVTTNDNLGGVVALKSAENLAISSISSKENEVGRNVVESTYPSEESFYGLISSSSSVNPHNEAFNQTSLNSYVMMMPAAMAIQTQYGGDFLAAAVDQMKGGFETSFSLAELSSSQQQTAASSSHVVASGLFQDLSKANNDNQLEQRFDDTTAFDIDMNETMLRDFNGIGIGGDGDGRNVGDLMSLQVNYDSFSSLMNSTTDDIIPDECNLQLGYAGKKHEHMTEFEELRLVSGVGPSSMECGRSSLARNVPMVIPERPELGLGSYAPELGMGSSDYPPVQLGWSMPSPVNMMTGGGGGFTSVCVWCSREFQLDGAVVEQQSDSLGFICPACKDKISGHLSLLNNNGSYF